MKLLGPRMVGLANKPAFRRFVVASVGGAFFLLGSAYLNLDRPQDIVVLKVVGAPAVRAGLPSAFRVVSSWAEQRRGAEVQVTDARVDGTSRLSRSSPGAPALVTIDIPATSGEDVALAFDVTTNGRTETLHVSVPVRRMAPEPALPEAPPKLQETQRAHRVSVRPEVGVLAAGMVNRVFVRVRNLQGEPLANASVRVSHKSFSGGAITLSTDGSGLAVFTVDARQPSFRFRFEVAHGGATTELEELLVPVGRQMLLDLSSPVSRPEQPITALLGTWRDDAEVYCDLVQGDVLLWSERVQAEGARTSVEIGPWPEGRYSLQCSDHPWVFGQAYATAPVLVSESPPLDALLTELRDQQALHPSGLVAPAGTDEAL
ncbi:MAG: hypothetical protein QF464_09100, partial [Myxococcota bacterium]|nr:hypothetical protein [Myxococcota bacterium]